MVKEYIRKANTCHPLYHFHPVIMHHHVDYYNESVTGFHVFTLAPNQFLLNRATRLLKQQTSHVTLRSNLPEDLGFTHSGAKSPYDGLQDSTLSYPHLISYFFPLTHFAPATLASSLFFKLLSRSHLGGLDQLFLSSGTFFAQIFAFWSFKKSKNLDFRMLKGSTILLMSLRVGSKYNRRRVMSDT